MDIIETQKTTYFDAILKDGVIVCHHIMAAEEIKQLKLEIDKIHAIVMAKIKDMERPLLTYTDIAERHLGRLDYRCGFNAEIFTLVGQAVLHLINEISPTINFRHYWGAIPALRGAGPTNMHRDVYPITNNMQGENLSSYDINLPPYYLTALVPLTEITQENGLTQFIKGSQRQSIVNINEAEIYSPLVSPGDVIIFDGRTLHKGLANQTNETRFVAYMTFIANWYHDQTFTINNYLFPELIKR